MNCPRCGESLERDAQFCPKCFARPEAPSLWQKFLSLFKWFQERVHSLVQIKTTVSIQTTDEAGQRHEYHSLDELPPQLRAEIETLQAEALRDNAAIKRELRSSSSEGRKTTVVCRKTVSLFKVKDASGKERIYHSLDEMPAELRAAFEQARKGQ